MQTAQEVAQACRTLADQLLHSCNARAGRLRTRAARGALRAAQCRKEQPAQCVAGRERAIVTDVPGTTRDTLTECVQMDGVRVVLTDTAGLRATEDAVERIGVERSRAALEEARLALLVVDGSEPLTAEDLAAMDEAEKAPRVLCLVNKSDRPWRRMWRRCAAADMPFHVRL